MLEKIAGYSILGVLGKGGMGVVYIGFDDKNNRLAALKILSDQIAPDPVAVKRFKREADLYARLKHPNVVASYDSGQYQGTHYIALELVQGRELYEIIFPGKDQGLRLTIVESLEIFRSIVSALQAIHALGIVHRDMKPHNVIINPFGVPKLLDFGVAQVTDDVNLTKTGLIIGTLLYASPEQNQGKAVDGRSDIYSLGVMLYEMLTGNRLFKGSNVGEIIMQQISLMKPTVADKVPGLPPEFDGFFARLCHPMLTSRFPDARSVLLELDQLVKSLGPRGRRILYGDPVDELWFASRLHFIRGEYQKSEDLAQKVLTQGKEIPAVYLLLGRIARELKDERKMIEAFTRVLRMSPSDHAARLEYVLGLNAFGKRELAIKEIDAILKVDPSNAYATGLRELFSHQVRWMSHEEVAARKRAVLGEQTTPDPSGEKEAEDRRAADESAFVEKVVAAMREEAARYSPSEVEQAAVYPGAGQFRNGQQKEGVLFLISSLACVVVMLWTLITGLDFHIPVYDTLHTFASEERMVNAIESNLEERVNKTFQDNRSIIQSFVMAFGVVVIFWLFTTSSSRAVAYARKKSLLCQVKALPSEKLIELDIGSKQGVTPGCVFQVIKISRQGKLVLGKAVVTEVLEDSARADYVPAKADADHPAAGDVLVPFKV